MYTLIRIIIGMSINTTISIDINTYVNILILQLIFIQIMAAVSAMFWLVDDHSRIRNVSSWQTLKLTAKPPSLSDDINTNECYYIIEDFELLWKRALNDRRCVVTSLSQDGWSFATLRIWLYKYPLKTADILRKLSRLLTEAKNL